jgi:protein TonB
MQLAQHRILNTPASGMTPRRAMIIGGVALLHVAAVYGLMTGMVTKVIDIVRPPLEVTVVEPVAPPKVVLPPTPTMTKPNAAITSPTVHPPVLQIAAADDDKPPPIHDVATPPNTPPPADSAPLGLSNTHTTPPYPAEARTLSHQGTVLLQMIVSAQGDVTAANVVQSSGFPELDQAAVSWVIGHWKYKPALQSGVAMAGQTEAAVRFDLKQARR